MHRIVNQNFLRCWPSLTEGILLKHLNNLLVIMNLTRGREGAPYLCGNRFQKMRVLYKANFRSINRWIIYFLSTQISLVFVWCICRDGVEGWASKECIAQRESSWVAVSENSRTRKTAPVRSGTQFVCMIHLLGWREQLLPFTWALMVITAKHLPDIRSLTWRFNEDSWITWQNNRIIFWR